MARPREFDRDDVLERAMRLFGERGYEATSIRDLIDAMGISSSSLYEAFGDKRGIFLAALARFCEVERAQIAQMAAQAASAQAFIQQLFDSVEDVANPQVKRSLAFNTMVEFGTLDPQVTPLLLTHYFGIGEIIAQILTQAQTDRTITTQEPPLNLAHTILTTLQGLATIKGIQPDFAYRAAITRMMLKLLDS